MRIPAVLAFLASFLLAGLLAAAAGVSEEQAYQAFVQAGCTECHDGSSAPDWKGTIQAIVEWAQNYDSIDEAVQNEYTFAGGADSYDEMMAIMREYAEGITDEQFNVLYQFFLQVFEEAKAARPQTPTTTTPPPNRSYEASTVTVTETQTITRTKTVTETLTKVVTETRESTVVYTIVTEPTEERLAPSTLQYAPLVGLILAVGSLAYLLLVVTKVKGS